MTRRGFLARLRMVSATASPRPCDEADGEAAQQGHVLRPVAGADTASIFIEAPVEDVMGRLDGPVPAIESEQGVPAMRLCGSGW